MEVLHKWNDQEIHRRSFLHHLERGREGGGGGGNNARISFKLYPFHCFQEYSDKNLFFFFGGEGGGEVLVGK